MDYILRKATLEGRAEIERLINESARGLSRKAKGKSQKSIQVCFTFAFCLSCRCIRAR
jgi:hypothetical protein